MHQAQSALRAHAVPGLSCPQPDRREGRLNRIRRANVLPMCGREVVEGEQLLSILHQAVDGLRVLLLVRRDEPIERLLSIPAAVSLPDLVQRRLRFRLLRLRQLVEDVHGLVDPTALCARRRKYLGQGGPEAHCAVSHTELRRRLEPSIPQAQQQCLPALFGLAKAFFDREEVLLSPGIAADQHQQTASLVATHVRVDAVRPQVNELVPAPVLLPPLGVLRFPRALQPPDRRRRQPLHRLAEQRRERLVEVVSRHALQVQPRQHRLKPLRLLQVRRQQLRAKAATLPSTVARLRYANLHGADPGQNLALRLVPVPDHCSPACSVLRRSVLLQKDLQLRFHRLPNDPLCALAYKVAELVVKGWIDERNNRIVGHGWRVSYLLKEGPGKPNFSRMRRLPQFSSYTRSDRSSPKSRESSTPRPPQKAAPPCSDCTPPRGFQCARPSRQPRPCPRSACVPTARRR